MSRKFNSFPLKKQNSCIENSTIKPENNRIGRKIALQKQFSIDLPNRSNDKSQNLNNQSVLSDCTDNNFKSLSIFGIKNQTDRSTTTKFEVKSRDRQKSNITYRRDERVNLNIFLNHNIKSNSDTVESESEKETYIPNFKPENIQSNDYDATYDERNNSARQGQFQGKAIQTTKTIRRPLIRARSAPVRSSEETKAFQTKRRSKQKKPGKGYQQSKEEQFFESDEFEDVSARKPKCHNKQLNVPPTRVRSAFGGCDVITLVSLFSSSESESEVEEYVSPRKPDCITITKPQLLRRCGKSVSFQENDLKQITSTTTEFPPMFRRGSIAPLARTFRDNKRPPTAPPASIYLKNDLRNTFARENINRKSLRYDEFVQQIVQSNNDEMENNEVKPAPVQKKKSEEVVEDYPEHCDTQKERDCWKLFKKMLGNGVTVNYDTILRGMLTPTELRTVMGKRVDLSQENEENENLPGT